MIHFLYNGDYKSDIDPKALFLKVNSSVTTSSPATSGTAASSTLPPLLLHANLYAIAEQYNIATLKPSSLTKYTSCVTTGWNHVSFTPSLKLIYETTPESDKGLRKVAVQAAAEHIDVLLNKGDFLDFLRENSDMATDILQAVVGVVKKNSNVPMGSSPVMYRLEESYHAMARSRRTQAICLMANQSVRTACRM